MKLWLLSEITLPGCHPAHILLNHTDVQHKYEIQSSKAYDNVNINSIAISVVSSHCHDQFVIQGVVRWMQSMVKAQGFGMSY